MDISVKEESIVLVGNGPSALNSKLGEKIDNFNIVVRFNNVVIDEYKDYVGSKTTYWIACDLFPCVQKSKDFLKIYYVSSPSWNYDDRYMNFYKNSEDKNKNLIRPFPEIVYWDIREKYGYYNPSSGLLSICLFSKLYKNVFLVGFDFFSGKKHHYGDNIDACHHDPIMERYICNRTNEVNNNIKILE